MRVTMRISLPALCTIARIHSCYQQHVRWAIQLWNVWKCESKFHLLILWAIAGLSSKAESMSFWAARGSRSSLLSRHAHIAGMTCLSIASKSFEAPAIAMTNLKWNISPCLCKTSRHLRLSIALFAVLQRKESLPSTMWRLDGDYGDPSDIELREAYFQSCLHTENISLEDCLAWLIAHDRHRFSSQQIGHEVNKLHLCPLSLQARLEANVEQGFAAVARPQISSLFP